MTKYLERMAFLRSLDRSRMCPPAPPAVEEIKEEGRVGDKSRLLAPPKPGSAD
jgi:hypothetical protein